MFGICRGTFKETTSYLGGDKRSIAYGGKAGQIVQNGHGWPYGAGLKHHDVLSLTVDLD